MARQETDREDLMREAVALARRVECEVPGEVDSVISGFRRNRWLSIYFGSDPVYHFDDEGRLRRAFAGGLLFRTQGTTLARLERVRTQSATELQRRDLSERELSEFLAAMRTRLEKFVAALDAGVARVRRQVPEEEAVVPELIGAIRRILAQRNPLAPAIRGKR